MRLIFANYCLIASFIFLNIYIAGTKYVLSHTLYEGLLYVSIFIFISMKTDEKVVLEQEDRIGQLNE